jgi:hypothetical protein
MAETKLIVDIATGAQTEVELTAAEISDRDQASALWEERQAELAAADEAKAALKASAAEKLAKLGLTAEEIAAIQG